ncbi:MAG: aspartate kinase [Spirochaetaceae bacterium]|nr:MAG: aspartate kinase [Spirochaetaceae bacterium]
MVRFVVKFGGSNLKSAADIRRSTEVVRAYGCPVVVVVSAFAGITDRLIHAIGEVTLALSSIDAVIEALRRIHGDALIAHVTDAERRAAVLDVIEERLSGLDRLLRGVHYIGSAPDFVSDAVLACGERLSAPVIAAALIDLGIDAVEALPEDIGLLTDGVHGNATALTGASSAAVSAALGGDRTRVVPGFYGVGKDGKTTLFGRGGSDYTAAVIARCVGAASLDLWKDVDGFLSCDPRIASDSRTIPYLTYEEAAELSYFGAKIFHPRTVEPLEGDAIPVRVMNVTRFAGAIEPYTTVGPPLGEAAIDPRVIKSVASTDEVAVVRLEGPVVGSRPGILARATSRLDAAGVNISSVITAQTSINLIFRSQDLPRALAALQADATPGVLTVVPIEDVALVAAVGEGIRDRFGVAGRLMMAVASEGVNVLMMQAGASPTAVYLIVHRDDRERTARAIHDAV